MAKLNKHELKKRSAEELNKNLAELDKELIKLRSQIAAGARIESPGAVQAIKKNKARIFALLNDKKGDTKKR